MGVIKMKLNLLRKNTDYKGLKKAYAFDDVLLVPRYSEVLPKDVNVKTLLTKKLTLNIPIISAAMDTVTESLMAIAVAREGGIGIIHRNMSIERQAKEVRRVKLSENGVILNPITITPEQTIEDAENLMHYYKISGLPVVENGKLIGLLTNRDIRFEKRMDTKVKELMTPFEKLITSYDPVTLEEAKLILQKHKVEKLPIIDRDAHLVGLITIKDIGSFFDHPNAARDNRGRLMVGAAIGIKDALERVKALVSEDVDVVVVDTSHGHTRNVIETVRKIKEQFPELQLIAGNVVTKEGTRALIEAGVDAVKVGVGPGSICTTRIISGVGVPQLTAIMDCASEASQYGIPVIADGGVRYSGDIAKAIAAGASTVMLGGLLAGTEEAPGEVILYGGRKFKSYRGMGSLGAMKEGSEDRYYQENLPLDKMVPEGIEGMVPYRGKVEEMLYQLIGGLRSGMAYCGVPTIEDFQKTAEFVEITAASIKESHPHDVFITKEAPNYESQRLSK
jgi:IMP dehydrogenase